MADPTLLSNLAFYSTPAYPCNYLPARQAVTMFADPIVPKNASSYATLSGFGFRRSGEHLYRPRCPTCHACIPVRVPVQRFVPTRSQRRTLRSNEDLDIRYLPAAFRSEHFELYRRYLNVRHPGGGMDDPTPESYMSFLTCSWATTWFVEMRQGDSLLAVAVVDELRDALSAVYTFFDPDYANRSLGRFAVLFEIEQARRQGLNWLYLGYWISNCTKMRYKNEYQPLQYFRDGYWTDNEPRAAL